MQDIFGKQYYIDLDAINEICKITPPNYDENNNEIIEINVFKFEIIKLCLERVLNEIQEQRELSEIEELRSDVGEKTSISFNFAFNTLVQNKVIKHGDNEYE